jgi:hypothetical protein
MSILGDLKGPLVVTTLSVVVLVVVGMVGLVAGLNALAAPGATLVTVLDALLPYLVALFLVGIAGVAAAAWGLYRLASGVVERNRRLLRNERVAKVAGYVERKSDLASQANLKARVEPSAEQRQQQLRDRYVSGDLSEHEFERRLETLLDDSNEPSTATGTRSPEREYTD